MCKAAALSFVLLLSLTILSCQKQIELNPNEIPSEDTASTSNKNPISNAGKDISITLPRDTVTVYGTAHDPDGSVVSFLWNKVSGPGSPTIQNPALLITQISGLLEGEYQFELRITDNKGGNGRDTLNISVKKEVENTPAGSLKVQQSFFGGSMPTVHDTPHYNSAGQITRISSNHYPERVISYNGDKISTIEYWFGKRSENSFFKHYTLVFNYDEAGNMFRIDENDHIDNKNYVYMEYEYNPDKTLKAKRGGTSKSVSRTKFSYTYSNGNLTTITELNDSGNPTNITNITYDNRVNNFKLLSGQHYFLDTQAVFDQTDRSEIFFYSKNYPTKYGDIAISVSTTSDKEKPTDIKFDNSIWYRYVYN